MSLVSEEEQVRRAQQGDREAWGELYEEYVSRVYRFLASRVGAGMEAEDMTEEVFLRAFKALPSYKWKGAPFAAWLFRIARNLIIDRQRKQATQGRFLTQADYPSPDPHPEEIAERKQMLEQVMAALPHLSSAQQEVIRLRFIAGLSLEETAQVMGKKTGAVKNLQFNALLNLKKWLKEESPN